MGAWLQLVGSLLALLGATPGFFGHSYSAFAGLRYAVGLTMGVAVTGAALFLLHDDWIAFFVLSGLCGLLGWLGAGLVLKRITEQDKLSSKQRRRQRRKQPDFWLTALIWVGCLLATVGAAVSIVEDA
jgi:hypothetical protein